MAFEKFLKFVYTGKQDVLGDDIPEMLRMAAIFQVSLYTQGNKMFSVMIYKKC